MKKYAICGVILCIAILGAYCSGYFIGKANTTIKYITQEKEVIRYVAKETAAIHAKPNATRDDIIGLYKRNKL